jgi:transcriptional regulator with XRE-family HTH domain
VAAVGKRSSVAQRVRLQAVLRDLRQEKGVTQTELALRLSRPQSFVSKYETGERRLDVLELREVCGALGVSFVSFARLLEKRLENLPRSVRK